VKIVICDVKMMYNTLI